MPNHIEPSQSNFTTAEQALADALTTRWPAMLTKAGSVIRELVVRPLAYLYSWLSDNMVDARQRSSMEYLMTSQATVNPVADAVASNYFVTRRTGVRSKGLVTMIVDRSYIQIPAGSVFMCEGVALMTEKTIIAINTSYRTDDRVQYVPIMPYSDGINYITNIPVVAVEIGAIELAPGAAVRTMFGGATTIQAYLTSAVTGGSGTETDAELMARAKYNTAESGIGSYYGIQKKLNNAPIAVKSFNIIAGEDSLLNRGRRNTVNINPGGYLDAYVRTQTQPQTALVASTVESTGEDTYKIEIDDSNYAGAYGVSRVLIGTDDSGSDISSFDVSFVSLDPLLDAASARLSNKQKIIITFTSETPIASNAVATVFLQYMPGINDLQLYMDTDNNRFIGQDICVKAAVPVVLSMRASLQYNGTPDADALATVKKAIADRVNAYDVGTARVNFSDIRDAVAAADPNASLRLPCSYVMQVPLRNGLTVCYASTTGIAEVTSPNADMSWPSAVMFFSLVPGNIGLEVE